RRNEERITLSILQVELIRHYRDGINDGIASESLTVRGNLSSKLSYIALDNSRVVLDGMVDVDDLNALLECTGVGKVVLHHHAHDGAFLRCAASNANGANPLYVVGIGNVEEINVGRHGQYTGAGGNAQQWDIAAGIVHRASSK